MAVPQPFSSPLAQQTADHAGMMFPEESEMFQAWLWSVVGGGAGGPALPTTAQAEHSHLQSTSAEQLQKKEYR